MGNRSKHMPTDSYFYLERQLTKFMIRNLCGPVITQNISMQKMSNYKVSKQNIPN